MNALQVRAELAAAREAGKALRARAPEAVRADLARVFDAWSTPNSPLARELGVALHSATGVDPAGLSPALEHWTGDAFLALVESELGERSGVGFPVTAVLLAGEIPMPSLLSMLVPLAVQSPVVAKMGTRDLVTAPLVLKSLEAHAPDLAPALRVLPPLEDEAARNALLEAECVMATGADATIRSIAARLRPEQRFIPAGHRFSVVVLGDDALRSADLDAVAARVARDVALWDQQGCLSPIAGYVVSPDPAAANEFGEALARELRKAATGMPRHELAPEEAAAFRHEYAEAELRAASNPQMKLHGAPTDGWAVVREADARMRPAPLNRFVRVLPVVETAALLDALRSFGPQLAGVALAGFGTAQRSLSDALTELGATRICEPGELQLPPLAWRREGRDLLTPLLAAPTP